MVTILYDLKCGMAEQEACRELPCPCTFPKGALSHLTILSDCDSERLGQVSILWATCYMGAPRQKQPCRGN